MKQNTSAWISEVRDYEVDFQGIVNNVHYFYYLAHARAMHLANRGLNIVKMSQEGINAVLIESKATFKKPLRYNDMFIITPP